MHECYVNACYENAAVDAGFSVKFFPGVYTRQMSSLSSSPSPEFSSSSIAPVFYWKERESEMLKNALLNTNQSYIAFRLNATKWSPGFWALHRFAEYILLVAWKWKLLWIDPLNLTNPLWKTTLSSHPCTQSALHASAGRLVFERNEGYACSKSCKFWQISVVINK